MKFSERSGKVIDRIINYLAAVAGAFTIAVMLVICYEVIMRYFFRKPPVWPVEICEYLLYLVALLGAAWLLKEHGHVRVDIVIGRLSLRTQTLLNVVTSAIGVIICLAIGWYGVGSTIDHFQRGIPVVKTLAIPKAPLLAFIPLGFFLLAIQFLRQTFSHLSSWQTMKKKE